ncbi:hypothetical protein JZO70_17510 [Enterococcus sp. 669A]|uniref:Uncharacterized protein n=1 Tax=Candidatus Enterococcus moelleringii TaxID=2815325 RepID=A0ABS3LEA7_9ENTE|nr:hypothetical protein [Enterococcus sp. 669A]MBO1307976.1 hypothetical protein [Enterococcus sp. 669A]
MSKKGTRDIKKETALKNFRYNRFLILRYLLAGFFFSNLYWLLMLFMSRSWYALLPASLFILTLPAIGEHAKLYGDMTDQIQNKLRHHKFYLSIQLGMNLVLLVISFTEGGFQRLYPFLTTSSQAKAALVTILLVGIFMSAFCIHRIRRIYLQQDKHYEYIQEFAKLKQKASE